MPAIPNVMALVCGYEEVMITEQACARLQARPGACGPLCVQQHQGVFDVLENKVVQPVMGVKSKLTLAAVKLLSNISVI